jgi:hypothetical protein
LLRPEQLTALPVERLKESLAEWQGFQRHDPLQTHTPPDRLLVTDLITSTSERLEQCHCASVEDVRQRPQKIVGLSPETAAMTRELKRFLYERLYAIRM